MLVPVESWGRYPHSRATVLQPEWLSSVELPVVGERSILPYGLGRSYGDSCQNDGQIIVQTARLNRFISFDSTSGVLRCEAGTSFREILDYCVPQGWFPPVTPGTKFVTVGGAVANDVHGKNHHRAGTFGRHVRAFELLRSGGARLVCTPQQNRELFCATIGGLGLTGLILWVELQLRPIAGPFIDVESIKFSSLDEFFEISADSESSFEYTVAWLDCVSRGINFGRGVFMRGNHSPRVDRAFRRSRSLGRVPFTAPSWLINQSSIRAFNFLYYHKQAPKIVRQEVHYDPFFYPLDALEGWNRLYGPRGFFQFQCVVPATQNFRAIRDILREIVASGKASFLAVLKEFGSLESPGLMSFPRPGITLALDFANEGESTVRLLRLLDIMVRECGGALYPAKDATMAAASFAAYFPKRAEFARQIDPHFSSSFWRRVSGEQGR